MKYSSHYLRLIDEPKAARTSLDWLRDVVSSELPDECIEWPYGCDRDGYGELRRGGKRLRAHRLALILSTGDEKPLDAAHECGNRKCINPRHLSWKTRQENVDDLQRHGTRLTGAAVDSAKLSEKDVKAIFALLIMGVTQAKVASQFGISQRTVSDIWTGKTWREVTDKLMPA